MKTFEINEELECKLQKIADDLKLNSIVELMTLGLHMVSLINTIESEGGSLLIENSKGFKVPLKLKEKQVSLEDNLIKELNKLKATPTKKKPKKKSNKSR